MEEKLANALTEAEEYKVKAAKAELEAQELRAENDALRQTGPPASVQEKLNKALAELVANAAEANILRAKAAEADELRTQLQMREGELLQLKKQHEQVRHDDDLFHKMQTITSKGKLEKIGSTLVHLKLDELRSLFVKELDQVLVAPPSAGAQPPDAIVHAVSETDAAVLMYRYLAVRNKGGMTSTELFEFHLHVAEDPEDPNLVTLRTLSDDEAKQLCGDAHIYQIEAKREKVEKKLKRVKVRNSLPNTSPLALSTLPPLPPG
jgi:hypothetical protein